MLLFVPVIVVCSLPHDVPVSPDEPVCASYAANSHADRSLEQCLINGVEIVHRYGGQSDVTSLSCQKEP